MTPGARRIPSQPWKQPAWEGIYLNSVGVLVNCGHRHRSPSAAERCARREARQLRPTREARS